MKHEQRRFARIDIPMTMTVHAEGHPPREMQTANISNGGAFIIAPPEHCPPVSAELTLQVKGLLAGKEPPLMRARVARLCSEGMGIELL